MSEIQSAYAQLRAQGLEHTQALREIAERYALNLSDAWREVFADDDEDEGQ